MKEKMQPEEAIEILEKTYIIAARRSGNIQNVKALALAINALRENVYITSSSSYKELQALRKFKKIMNDRRGEWIWDGYNSLYCTACKKHKYLGEDPDIPAETRFCPNCGAKMKRH